MPVSLTHFLSSSWISSSLGYLSTTPASWRQVLSRSEIWIQQQQYRSMNPVAGWKTRVPVSSHFNELWGVSAQMQVAFGLFEVGRMDRWVSSFQPWSLQAAETSLRCLKEAHVPFTRSLFQPKSKLQALSTSFPLYTKHLPPSLQRRDFLLWKVTSAPSHHRWLPIRVSGNFCLFINLKSSHTICPQGALIKTWEIFVSPGWIPAPPCSS